jgi:hypothetical protein
MLEYVPPVYKPDIELTEEEFQQLASKLQLVNFDKKTRAGGGRRNSYYYFILYLKGISRRYFYRGKQEVHHTS